MDCRSVGRQDDKKRDRHGPHCRLSEPDKPTWHGLSACRARQTDMSWIVGLSADKTTKRQTDTGPIVGCLSPSNRHGIDCRLVGLSFCQFCPTDRYVMDCRSVGRQNDKKTESHGPFVACLSQTNRDGMDCRLVGPDRPTCHGLSACWPTKRQKYRQARATLSLV